MELADFTDVELLALLIAGEADDQPLSGKVAAAQTVIERYRRQRSHYGRTIREIILKPAQYSTFNDGVYWRTKVGRIPAYMLMAELAIDGSLRSRAEGSTHFCRHDLKPMPDWAEPQYSLYMGRIESHNFYREF